MSNTLTLVRGDDKIYDVEIKDADGNVVDITNYTVKFTVRCGPRDTSYKIFKRTPSGSGISLVDPVNGKARITLSGTDTDITSGRYVYDVELTDSSGRRSTVIVDQFFVKNDVTR